MTARNVRVIRKPSDEAPWRLSRWPVPALLAHTVGEIARARAVGDYRPVDCVDHLLRLSPSCHCIQRRLPASQLAFVLTLQPGGNGSRLVLNSRLGIGYAVPGSAHALAPRDLALDELWLAPIANTASPPSRFGRG